MKIGIIGSGEVGQVLGKGFLAEGHAVLLGTRDPSKESVVKWKSENANAKTGTFQEAASFGELLVLAVAGIAAEQALMLAGSKNLAGKTIIDVTNPIAPAPPEKGVLKLTTTLDESMMEELQRQFPAAHFVKAFNSVGSSLMYKPSFTEGIPTMFICGNDANAKKQVTEILTSFGWDTEDMGTAEGARAIEPLCILWCIPGFLRNQWTHAFKLLMK
jgi:hypothetical protein